MSRPDDMQVIEERVIKPNGELIFKRYTKGRLLGKGGFASVYELTLPDKSNLSAIKMIDKTSLSKGRARQKLMSEIRIHRSLSHANIVAFEHHFEDDNFVYMILELCTNQTLSDLLRRRKRLTELEIKCYLFQAIQALKYLHSHRVIHRDIKLGNIFLDDKMELKLGDFGLAAKLEFEGERKRTICGTPNYIAPEILDGRFGHSYEVDIWSLGVLMYTLLIGKPPFETNDVKTTYKRIRMNSYSFPEHVPISLESKDLIERILVSDPSGRLRLAEIEEHPFFVKSLIPKVMPVSTLAVPPTAAFLRIYEKKNSNLSPINRVRDLSGGKSRASSNQDRSKKEDRPNSGERASSRDKFSSSGSSTKKNANVSIYSVIPNGPRVFVKKWVDHSGKYGIGYALSNGCAGVYFNDNTKIVSNKEGTSFQYLWKGENDDLMTEHGISSYPPELKKKVTILIHFKKHLVGENTVNDCESNLVHVKKWITTSHAIIFRLSNKLVQVFFTDKSELLLCSKNKVVVYVSKTGDMHSSQLALVMESNNREMMKRFKYTREVLTNMLNQVN